MAKKVSSSKEHLCKVLQTELPKAFASSRCSSRKKRSDPDTSLEPIVNEMFSKQFPINNDGFTLPRPESMYTEDPWKVTELEKLKFELNEVKNKLNDYNVVDWHQHTRQRNKAGDVHWRVKKEISPEFLTQAWCKFYENASRFPLVSKAAIEAGELVSVHLCEAPGAFVTSLNHWLKTNEPRLEWDWIATTLNPYYEGNPLTCMINDDRFIVSSLDHWSFGTDYTGNLMNLKNMDHLVETAKKKGDVLLVTADGSIDCIEYPGQQESVVAPLHFCEAVTALHLLSTRGSLLLKMFTLFEHESVCLVYLLSCLFDQIIVNKPVTSKEGNSEVYVVCLEYRGSKLVAPYLKILRKFYEEPSGKSMFRKQDIPQEFFERIISCAEFFKNFQTEVISQNIETFQQSGVDFDNKRIKHMIANKFIKSYGLRKLKSTDMEVVGETKASLNSLLHFESSMPDGSYNTRRSMESLDPVFLLLTLCYDQTLIDVPATTTSLQFRGSFSGLHICRGKPFSLVQSSKFCMRKILKNHNKIVDLQNRLNIHLPPYDKQSISNAMETNYIYDCEYMYFDDNITNNQTICMIHDTLDRVKAGTSLVLIGYPMLTQLNVGILNVLGHMFQSLRIQLNDELGCIIILNFNMFVEDAWECIKKLHDAAIQAEEAHESVLSVLPMTKLYGFDIYETVVNANHWSLKRHATTIIDCVQKGKYKHC